MLLHSPIDTSLPHHAFPERMQTMQLIVVYSFMLQINIFCLTCPILQLYNLCKVGHMSQVFDFGLLSVGFFSVGGCYWM